MADLNTIQNALANVITTRTGLRTLAQARDQISPPIAVILPGNPLILFKDTMDGTVTISLSVLIVVSDAAPSEKSIRALNQFLGVGSGESESIAGAIAADSTLGGNVHWTETISVSNYGRIEYAGVPFFGAKINCQLGYI